MHQIIDIGFADVKAGFAASADPANAYQANYDILLSAR